MVIAEYLSQGYTIDAPGNFVHLLAAACGPRLPRSDRTEIGPLTEEHRPRINGAGR